MPTLRLPDGTALFYTVDDFTDPWTKPETILLCHGNNESHRAWYGWVPHLARHYRVVRPDMRGFGDSTPMPRDLRKSSAASLQKSASTFCEPDNVVDASVLSVK